MVFPIMLLLAVVFGLGIVALRCMMEERRKNKETATGRLS
jgi:hypothetical protein